MVEARVVLMKPDASVLRVEDNIISLEAARAENAAGSFSCVIPHRPGYEQIGPDYTLLIQCRRGGEWVNDLKTLWYVRAESWSVTGEDTGTVTLSGHDSFGLLGRRVVAYFGVEDTELAQNYYTIKNKPSLDALRDVVRENFTDAVLGVDAADLPGSIAALGVRARIMPGIVVEGNDERGQVIKAEFAWAVASDALSTIAAAALEKGDRVIYDLISEGGGRHIFRCWLGQRGRRLTDTVVFSPRRGNVTTMERKIDYTSEVTWLHVAGEGQAKLRLMQAVLADDPIRTALYPIEGFYDASSAKNDSALMTSMGVREMARKSPRWIFTAEATDAPGTTFGVDYELGDVVSVSHMGVSAPCRIGKVTLRVENSVASYVIPLESEEPI